MLNQPYSRVSTISQQASCFLFVIVQGVFEHSGVVNFLHKQCDVKCKETGVPPLFHHTEMQASALFFDTKTCPAVGKLWDLIGKDHGELFSFLVFLPLLSLLHREVQFLNVVIFNSCPWSLADRLGVRRTGVGWKDKLETQDVYIH